MAEVALIVSEEEAPEVYKLSEEDSVEIGPFTVRRPRLRTGPVDLAMHCTG